MVSKEGEREPPMEDSVLMELSGGGNEVWRRGCEAADMVESMLPLRRLLGDVEDGMSDCRRLGG
jgi:hypothetical protein